MNFYFSIFCIIGLSFSFNDNNEQIYLTKNGQIHFESNAPLELIKASSNELKGAIDPEKNLFAFTVEISSFQGFNSPLQREHFNENYLESSEFKTASFTGKIIEKMDLTKDGEYTLRAKGTLKIHGISQERIIKSKAFVQNGILTIESHFIVLLKEHDIAIPKIVYQKIAEEIHVTVKANFNLSDA